MGEGSAALPITFVLSIEKIGFCNPPKAQVGNVGHYHLTFAYNGICI